MHFILLWLLDGAGADEQQLCDWGFDKFQLHTTEFLGTGKKETIMSEVHARDYFSGSYYDIK